MRRRDNAGFTLVEALVVVVIAGVVLAIALPRFNSVRQGIQIDGAAQQLAGDLRRAQVEAIKRNRSIELRTTGTTTYTIDSIGARSFDDGVVFGASSSSSVRMATFGPPVGGAASFTLELGARRKTIDVSAAGFVSVR
jgi:prepilin-type N-terminal cleavage/methylation domain-containing protein